MLCIGWGLCIRTPIALPGAVAAPLGEEPAIEIAFGTAPGWRERVAWGPYRVADADLFDFTMAGVARFTCLDRRRIVIDAEDGASEDGIAAMLIATALPALLWARGEIVLHCAAALGPTASTGILVAGESGSGKSTLLSRAIGRGFASISDDSVRVRVDQERVLASGLPGGIWQRRGPGDGRAFIPIPAVQQRAEHSVATMIAIQPHGRRRLLGGTEALATLLRHRHRPRIAALLGTEPGFIGPLAHIARRLRIVSVPPANSLEHSAVRASQYAGETIDDCLEAP